MASAEHVVRYLGQYTHRVAITNQRIVNVSDEKVTFIAKDYRQGAAKKYITLVVWSSCADLPSTYSHADL